MFVIGHLLSATASVLQLALKLYMLIVIARAVVSWVSPDPYNPIVRFLNAATEPVLYRVRRLLPVYFGGVDFAPLVVILGIVFLQRFLVMSLEDIALRLR